MMEKTFDLKNTLDSFSVKTHKNEHMPTYIDGEEEKPIVKMLQNRFGEELPTSVKKTVEILTKNKEVVDLPDYLEYEKLEIENSNVSLKTDIIYEVDKEEEEEEKKVEEGKNQPLI
jgi:hypothetical protein